MLAYVDAIERKESITIDGFSSNKTMKGVIKDVARAVRKYNSGEADSLEDCAKNKIDEFNNPFVCSEYSCGGYFLKWMKSVVRLIMMKKKTKLFIEMVSIIIFVSE